MRYYDVLIVGAGHAGAQAGIALRASMGSTDSIPSLPQSLSSGSVICSCLAVVP